VQEPIMPTFSSSGQLPALGSVRKKWQLLQTDKKQKIKPAAAALN
jgi:hypothetical protein